MFKRKTTYSIRKQQIFSKQRTVRHASQDVFVIQQLFTMWDKKVNNEIFERQTYGRILGPLFN